MAKNDTLFKTYSSNFALVLAKGRPDIKIPQETYPCPLCGHFFGVKHLEPNQDNFLTIEHVPPKSLGGSNIILTCKNCNSEHGRNLDGQLYNKIKAHRFMKSEQEAELNVRYRIADKIPSDGKLLRRATGEIVFHFDADRTNPKFKEDILQILQGKKGEVKLDFTFQKGEDNKATLSMLRTGYLLAFKKLGYAFVLSKSAQKISSMLMKEESLSSVPLILNAQISKECDGIYIISKPLELRSYLAIFNLHLHGYYEKIAVVLPGAHDDELEIYNQIKLCQKDNSLNLTFSELPEKNFLTDENYCMEPFKLWF